MKKLFFLIFPSIIFCINVSVSHAQKFDNPGAYIFAVNQAAADMYKTCFAYTNAAAHSGTSIKFEKMRRQAIESITDCKYKITKLPAYKNDSSLRTNIIDFANLYYQIFNDDYARVIDMEETSDQSVDEMKEYLLLKENTNEKFANAMRSMDSAEKIFAVNYNVTLPVAQVALDEKADTANNVTHYRNGMYMLFFKCNLQNTQLAKAISTKDFSEIERTRNMLVSYVKDGLAILDTTSPFNDDHSLINACKNALLLYKSIGENDVPKLTDALQQEQNFDKIKAAYDSNFTNKTKAEIEAYNKAANDANTAIDNYNAADNKRNNSTTQALQDWNDGEKSFLDIQIPYYKEQKK